MRIQYRTEMWAEYLASAYPQFLASEDYDIETERQRLNDRYREAGENTRAEILRNTEELERLKMEFDVLARQEVRHFPSTFSGPRRNRDSALVRPL